MKDLLQFVIIGIASGAVYGLFALGIVLVNNSTRILDFGQGEIGGLAAFVMAQLAYAHGVTLWLALPAGVVVGGIVGFLAWFFLVRTGHRGSLPPLVGTVALISFLVIVEDHLGGQQFFPTPVEGGIAPFGVTITYIRLLVMVTVAVFCIGLWLLLFRTPLGLQLRAGADNRRAATLVGLRPQRAEAVAWTMAGILAAVAAYLLGWIQNDIGPGYATIALPSIFAAAIVGGMSSLPGCIVGGLIVGVCEAMTRKIFGDVPGSTQLVVFLLIALTLFLRPQGLFGRRGTGLLSEASESLVELHPLVRVPSRRRRPDKLVAFLIGTAVTVALITVTPLPTAYKLSLLPIYALLALSLNFLVASTGQVSLCHVSFLGFGAFMTAVSATTWGMPPVLAAVVGGLSTGAIACVVGIAALRVRGLYLAVLTFALGYGFEQFLFPKPFFSKGGAGIAVDRPTILGLNLGNERVFLGIAVAALALFWIADKRLMASPLGRALIGLRDNGVAAAARGIGTRALPVAAFTFSGTVAGFAGALYVFRLGLVSPTSFSALGSLAFVIYVVIGGIAARAGVVAVTAMFVGIATFNPSWLQGDWVLLAGSLGVVLSIGAHPEGVGGQVRAAIDKRRGRVGDSSPAPSGSAGIPVETGSTLPALRSEAPAPSGVGVHPSTPLVGADHLTVRFSGLVALDDVSIAVHPGEIVAVIGPNGAGKTTLFNCLSGFVSPTQGHIYLGGRRVDRVDPSQRAAQGLGRTFQQGGLCLSETALSNLLIAQHHSIDSTRFTSLLGAGPRERRRELQRVELARRVLAILRLAHVAEVPVSELPYGVRKTLEIGCALVSRPTVLLLDEPAAGASQREAAELAGVIHGIRDELGIGVLVIEHHVPLIRDVADRVYVLNFGKLLAEGTPDEVTNDPAVREAYLGGQAVPAGASR